MASFIAWRIISTIPVAFVVSFLVFSLLYLAPGDPALIIAGDNATAADIARIRMDLGLDQPFLQRYGIWMAGVLQGDLGQSVMTGTPISVMITQRLGPTFSLMIVSLILTLAVAIPLGIIAAVKAGGVMDRLIMGFAIFGFSAPVFVVGYVLAYVFALRTGLLPVQGYAPLRDGVGSWLSHLIMPAVAVGTIYIAIIARITRTSMLEVLRQDCIRTARAKGAGPISILCIHSLKLAAVPIMTVIGMGLAMLITGTVVTENVFAIPGLGRLTVDAILRRDYPVIQGIILTFSAMYVVVNLLVDVIYGLLDPRIRY